MDFFRHPGLAALGAALIAVPILIHLLNRRRFKVVRWGAMTFLLAAFKKTRRRLELENLLLLLLRALAVALLGLAVARPMLSSDSPLATMVGARRDVVIVLDASYSMAYRDGASSSYDRGLAHARSILEQLKPERQDRATVILAKQRPVRISASSIPTARDALARAPEPTFEGMDLAASFELAAREVDAFTPDDAAGAPPAGALLFLITDLQRSTFFPRAAAPAPDAARPAGESAGATPIQAAVAALGARKVAIRVLDVGPGGDGPVENVAIVDVPLPDDTPATGVPVEVRATVRNWGATPRTGVVVTPTVDGNREPTQTVDLPAGESRTVSLTLSFRDAGDHAIEVALEDDKLPVDDRRACAVHVRPPVRVLLVDGGPAGADPEMSAAGMLQIVLAPSDEANTVVPFQLVGGQAFQRAAFASRLELLEQADVVVLANVEGFSDEQAARLRDFAASGGGVLFFLGDQVDPGSYAARLRPGDDASKWLLPGAIGAVRALPSRDTRPWRIAHVPDPLPAQLRFFQPAERRVLLTEVPVYSFLSVDVTEDDVKSGAEVLARYDDPDSSPFLVTRPFGQGRVAVVTTSVDLPPRDKQWSRIADSVKTFVPLVFDLLHATAGGDDRTQNVLVGQPIRATVLGFPRKAAVIDPTGRREELNVETAKPLGAERYQLPPFPSTPRPGLYRMEVETAGGVGATSTSTLHFAVGVEPSEGDLTRMPGSTLGSAFPGADLKLAPGLEEEAAPPVEPSSGEIWKALLIGALAVLVLESALATWFGRRRA